MSVADRFLYGVGLTKDEIEVVERAIDGGALDEPICAFFSCPHRSPEEDAAGARFDEVVSAILGRAVRAWQPHRCNGLDGAINKRHALIRGYR
jgi:hypothetical protein